MRNKIDTNIKKNLKMMLLLIYICVLGLILFWFIYYKYYIGYPFKEWISLMATLIASVLGGIFTMLGVVLTINRDIDNENKKEKDMVQSKALIVVSEMEAHIESAKDCICRMLNSRILKSDENELEFFEKCGSYMIFDNIYFVSNNTKDYFYDVISKADYINKEKIIKSFINFYTIHERIRNFYKANNRNNRDFFNCVINSYFENKVINIYITVFKNIKFINEEMENDFYKNESYFEAELGELCDIIDEIEKTNFITNEFKYILSFLKEISKDKF